MKRKTFLQTIAALPLLAFLKPKEETVTSGYLQVEPSNTKVATATISANAYYNPTTDKWEYKELNWSPLYWDIETGEPHIFIERS